MTKASLPPSRPRTKMAEKWPAAVFRRGRGFPGNGPGKWLDMQKIARLSAYPAICPAILEAPREMAAGHFAGHFLDYVDVRNQEKGVLAKGVSVESSVTAKETKKHPRILAPAVHLALRASQPREAYIFQKPPSKNPLLVVPDDGAFQTVFFCNLGSAGGGGWKGGVGEGLGKGWGGDWGGVGEGLAFYNSKSRRGQTCNN